MANFYGRYDGIFGSGGGGGGGSTGDLTDVGTDGIVITNGTGAVNGAGTQIAQHVADATHNGYLSSADFVTFSGKGTGTVTAVSVATANGLAGTSSGGATPALTLSTTINSPVLAGNGTAISAATTTGSGSTVVLATAPTMTNPVVGTQSQGDSSTKAASTSYVDVAVANAIAGVNPAVAVQAATTAAGDTSGLTYNNGVSGIGATFTGSNNTALVVDGFTFTALGQRLLVKNDTQSPSGAFNGVYYVTQVQTAILPPILTRALDYDTPSDMNNTGAIPVISGTVNGTTSWVLTSQVVTVGTTPLSYTKFSINPSTIVTAVSVATANGLAGSSSGGTTPALTLSTTITGILKGNGTAISAAAAGTDYQAAGNYITALTGDVAASGPNSAAATLATVNTNVGSFTNANITVNAKGLVTAASSGSSSSPRSEVTVDSGNGYGSTATQIRRFVNTQKNSGSNITYADSAANGGTFTVNADGIYSISYSDGRTSSVDNVIEITVNDTATTTSAPTTYAQGARIFSQYDQNGPHAVSWTGFIASGGVVRAHGDGSQNITNQECMFTITQVNS